MERNGNTILGGGVVPLQPKMNESDGTLTIGWEVFGIF